MQVKQPVISVIAPCYNQLELIKRTLYWFMRQDFNDTYEIIFLDDGSNDGTKEYLIEFINQHKINNQFQNVILRYYYFNRPYHISCGHTINHAIKHLVNSDIVVINTGFDRIPRKNVLKSLYEPFKSNTNINIISCVPTKHIGTTGSWEVKDVSNIYDKSNWEMDSLNLDKYSNYNQHCFPDNALECVCFAMFKQNFIELGGYDEDYVMAHGNANLDLFSRFKQKGLNCVWHNTFVYHQPHGGQRSYDFFQKTTESNTLVRNLNREWGTTKPEYGYD